LKIPDGLVVDRDSLPCHRDARRERYGLGWYDVKLWSMYFYVKADISKPVL
jgi:hypothetical protein